MVSGLIEMATFGQSDFNVYDPLNFGKSLSIDHLICNFSYHQRDQWEHFPAFSFSLDAFLCVA